jgi:hypothetical protein
MSRIISAFLERTHKRLTNGRRRRIAKEDYGPVLVTDGVHAGRIGYFDDHDEDGAIVYFGDFLMTQEYYLIPFGSLREPTMRDMFDRWSMLKEILTPLRKDRLPTYKIRCQVLTELIYVQAELTDRMIEARQSVSGDNSKKIFLCHSSSDKGIARSLHDDLKRLGHRPWLDENEILVGQSIPDLIQKGLVESDFVIVCLSSAAVASTWVSEEWTARFMRDLAGGQRTILPALLEACELPPFLSTKKYARFDESYAEGLASILQAIGSDL